MKLSKSNPFLRSASKAKSALWVSAKSSSAIEGIRQPFAAGPECRAARDGAGAYRPLEETLFQVRSITLSNISVSSR